MWYNIMASVNQTGNTLSRTYVSVACTPTTNSKCVLFAAKKKNKSKKTNKQTNKNKKQQQQKTKTQKHKHTHKRRVQLFKNDKKTESCVLIEEYLEIQLIPDQTIKRVCNNCQRSLNTIQSRVQVHKQNYEKTVSQLKKITWSFEQKEAAVRWFASDSIQKNLSRPYIPRPCASKFILYNSVYII